MIIRVGGGYGFVDARGILKEGLGLGAFFAVWEERSMKSWMLAIHRRPVGRKHTGRADSAETGRPLPLRRTMSVEGRRPSQMPVLHPLPRCPPGPISRVRARDS